MPVPASRNKSITPPLLSFSYSAWWDKNKTLAISFVHMCHWGRTTPCQPEHSSSKAYFLPEHAGSNKENKSVSLSCSISGGGIYYTHEASLKASSHFPPLSLIHPNAAYAPSWQKPPINTCWGQRQAAESQRAPFPLTRPFTSLAVVSYLHWKRGARGSPLPSQPQELHRTD